jgi:hypothetical protein
VKAFLTSLLTEAYARPRPAPDATPSHRRVWVRAETRGLMLGAPVLDADEVLSKSVGEAAPLVRYVLTLKDVLDAADAPSSVLPHALLAGLATVYADPEDTVAAFASGFDAARVVARIEKGLRRRKALTGHPMLGLPLRFSFTAIDAQTVLSTALSCIGGNVPVAAAVQTLQNRDDARRELFLRGLVDLDAQLHRRRLLDDAQTVAVHETRVWQVGGLGFPAAHTKRLLAALTATDTKPAFDDDVISLWLRHACLFIFNESHHTEQNSTRVFDDLVNHHGVHPAVGARLEERAKTFFMSHPEEFDWLLNAKRFEAAHPPLTVRMTTALSENVDAFVEAMRDSGDFATLLAKRARGDRLSPAEMARLKQQLVDVAKAVPALAIFALPGGMLLLPLLLKLLPFDLRPTSFRRRAEFHAFAHDATDTLAAESTDPARPSFWRRQR